MMTVPRLRSVAPELADALERASPPVRRRAARAACEVAISRIGSSQEVLRLGMDALQAERPNDEVRRRLQGAALSLDEQYWQLSSDETHQDEALRAFSEARVASALVYALSEDHEEFNEAVYEAMTALDDPSEVVRVVAETLSTGE